MWRRFQLRVAEALIKRIDITQSAVGDVNVNVDIEISTQLKIRLKKRPIKIIRI